MDTLSRLGITRWQLRVRAGHAANAQVILGQDLERDLLADPDLSAYEPHSSLAEQSADARALLSEQDEFLPFEDDEVVIGARFENLPVAELGAQSPKANAAAEAALEPEKTHPKSAALVTEIAERSTSNLPASSTLTMRGRVLSGKSNADVFVVACSEGRNKDVLIDMHQESGRLLNAMLKSVFTAPSSAMPSTLMIGADNGDKASIGKLMLLVGERAAKTVLGPDVKPPYRGKVHLVSGVRAVCTYHPEELRQNATLKPMAWDDLRLFASLLPKEQ